MYMITITNGHSNGAFDDGSDTERAPCAFCRLGIPLSSANETKSVERASSAAETRCNETTVTNTQKMDRYSAVKTSIQTE